MDPQIVVGSYDQLVLGYSLLASEDGTSLEPSFTDNTHSGCVKCMAVSYKGVLASGGTDETIRLLDVKKKKELGSLVHHNGSITCLAFYRGFMFSASEDGSLCLWSTRNWECLRTFKGHKGSINSISVHPSGKLALSVGRDKTLRTWNLMTGKVAYVTNLKQEGDIVKWSTEGDTYAIVVNNTIDIYCVQTAAVKRSYKAEGRIHCLEYLKNDVLVYGGEGVPDEGSQIFIQHIEEDEPLHVSDKMELTRIKALCITPSPLADEEHSKLLAIASSDGLVCTLKLNDVGGKISTDKVCEYNAKFRLTCITAFTKASNQASTRPEAAEEETADDVLEEAEEDDSDAKQPDSDQDDRGARKARKRKRKRKHGDGGSGDTVDRQTVDTHTTKPTTQHSGDMDSKAKKLKLQKKAGKAQKKKKKSAVTT